ITGLTADNDLKDYADGREKALERVAALKLEVPPGTRFKYSDVGFIVLGELVEKVGGLPVDQFARKHVFDPLKLTDTGFKPGERPFARGAPTRKPGRQVNLGAVH